MPTVYSLKHPVTNKIYYVGFTKQRIADRLLWHLINKKHYTTNILIQSNLTPLIDILEDGENVTTVTERNWIRKLSEAGEVLENIESLNQPIIRTVSIPEKLIESTPDNTLNVAIQCILEELPLNSTIPIINRIKNIAEWALNTVHQ